jgi:hypothetical protein
MHPKRPWAGPRERPRGPSASPGDLDVKFSSAWVGAAPMEGVDVEPSSSFSARSTPALEAAMCRAKPQDGARRRFSNQIAAITQL